MRFLRRIIFQHTANTERVYRTTTVDDEQFVDATLVSKQLLRKLFRDHDGGRRIQRSLTIAFLEFVVENIEKVESTSRPFFSKNCLSL